MTTNLLLDLSLFVTRPPLIPATTIDLFSPFNFVVLAHRSVDPASLAVYFVRYGKDSCSMRVRYFAFLEDCASVHELTSSLVVEAWFRVLDDWRSPNLTILHSGSASTDGGHVEDVLFHG